MSEPSPSPDALPADQLRRAWLIVAIAGALGSSYFTICVGSAPRLKYLEELGITTFHIGVMSAAGSLALTFQILGAIWTNYMPRRKAIWMVITIIHRITFLGILAAPVLFLPGAVRIWWIVGAACLHDSLANLGGPMWATWMADILPRERLSRMWAWRQRVTVGVSTVVGFLVALVFLAIDRPNHVHRALEVIRDHGLSIPSLGPAGFLAHFHMSPVSVGFMVLGGLGLVLGVIDICLFAWVPEPPNDRSANRGNVLRAMVQPLLDPEFRPFLYFRAYWQFSAALAYPFFGWYIITFLGVKVVWAQFLFMMGPLGVVVSTRFWGLICDTYGQRPVLLILLVGKGVIPLTFVLTPPIRSIAVPVIALMFFLDGILNSAFELSNTGIILKTTPRRNRGMYIAANSFFSVGIPAAIAPLVAGWTIYGLKDHVWTTGVYRFSGYHLIFLISMLMRGGAIFFAKNLREPGSQSVPTVLRHLTQINPFRVTRHIYRLSDSRHAAKRLDSARRLGEMRCPLAIRDLIAALRDPERPVRHAAAEALGRIGNAEACEPLARALTDPELGIQSPVARALGHIGGFDSLQALLRNLRNLDREALGETIDSLARIGDSAAILPLICLMDDNEDVELRRRIAAALALLTETPTAEEVISIFTNASQAKRPSVMV